MPFVFSNDRISSKIGVPKEKDANLGVQYFLWPSLFGLLRTLLTHGWQCRKGEPAGLPLSLLRSYNGAASPLSPSWTSSGIVYKCESPPTTALRGGSHRALSIGARVRPRQRSLPPNPRQIIYYGLRVVWSEIRHFLGAPLGSQATAFGLEAIASECALGTYHLCILRPVF